jgi:hypothetical protein
LVAPDHAGDIGKPHLRLLGIEGSKCRESSGQGLELFGVGFCLRARFRVRCRGSCPCHHPF